MIRVLANLSFVVPGVVGGSEQHSVGLIRAVREHEAGRCAVTVAGSTALLETYPDLATNAVTVPGPAARRPYRVAAESLWLPAHSRSVDLTHHFGGRLPARVRPPATVTIHDLQPLDHAEHFSRIKARYLARALPRTGQRSTLVLTPSQWVADRVRDRLGVPSERLRVVGPAVAPPSDPFEGHARLAAVADRRLIVFPAITHPHKNHQVLVEAIATIARRNPDVLLVLTGGAGAADQSVGQAIAAVDPAGRHIQHWGRVSTALVRATIDHAELLVFPSRYEGFGIPVVEAMAQGTAVVASRAACLPEVVGDAGRLVDEDKPEAWAAAVLELLADNQERERLATAGRTQALHWSPPVAAARLVDAWVEAGNLGADR